MPLATLAKVLSQAQARNAACLGFVCQGWEDARAYVAAGEAAGAPVILSAGPGARANMPVPLWGEMFRTLARSATIPVVAHLDHGRTVEECVAAIDAGFSSVMIDGSALPLAENIALTNAVSDAARAVGVSVEAEVGQVGYEDGAPSAGTTLEEATTFAAETRVDALAISVGNLHLQTKDHAIIDWQRLAEIEAVTSMPLVLHGGSGIRHEDRARLAQTHRVRKLNVGTELRQRFGGEIRAALMADPDLFDRTAIITRAVPALQALATDLLRQSWRG